MAKQDRKNPVLYKDRTKIFLNILFRWGPVVLWMVFIFLGSASSTPYQFLPSNGSKMIAKVGGNKVTERDILGTIGHSLEYAVLAVLACYAVIGKNQLRVWNIGLVAIFAGIYAFSDEFHQLFVPGRLFELRDLGLDAVGILLGFLAYGAYGIF